MPLFKSRKNKATPIPAAAAKQEGNAGPPPDFFERIHLPNMIKHSPLQEVAMIPIRLNESGKPVEEERTLLCKRENTHTVIYKWAMDMLEKHNNQDEVFAFLLDKAKTPKIFLADSEGIKFYLRDAVDENGKRKFLWIFYHSYTEKLNQELKEALKGFAELGWCYGVAECESYYLMPSPLLEHNQAFHHAAAPIVCKHLPEGYQLALAGIKEETTIEAFEDSIKASDYERLF